MITQELEKEKINPRKLLDAIAGIEKVDPYLIFSDNVNDANPLDLPVKFSNLCTEILQPTITSHYGDYGKEDNIGMDISCNLASGNMEKMIENNTIKETVFFCNGY